MAIYIRVLAVPALDKYTADVVGALTALPLTPGPFRRPTLLQLANKRDEEEVSHWYQTTNVVFAILDTTPELSTRRLMLERPPSLLSFWIIK